MVVAGISGLVVAATQPGSSFWSVSALGVIRRRLISGPPRQRRITAIAGQLTGHGRTVVVTRPGPVGVPSRAARLAAGPPANWYPAPNARAVAIPAGPGPRIQVDAPAGAPWHMLAGHGQGTIHITTGGGPWPPGLLVPLALLLLTLGLWLLPRSAPARGPTPPGCCPRCGGGCWRIAGAFS